MDRAKLLDAIARARGIAWSREGKCFGFVRHIVNQFGANVPDYNYPDSQAGLVLFYENFSRYVQPVQRKDLGAGDIVSFAYRHAFHLGVYVGEGRMAHWRGAENGIVFERIDVPPICRGNLGFYRAMTDAAED